MKEPKITDIGHEHLELLNKNQSDPHAVNDGMRKSMDRHQGSNCIESMKKVLYPNLTVSFVPRDRSFGLILGRWILDVGRHSGRR